MCNSINKKDSLCMIGSNQLLFNLLIERGFQVSQFGHNSNPSIDFNSLTINDSIKSLIDKQRTNNFIILSGFLQSKKITDQTRDEITKSFFINSIGPILFAEYLLKINSNARLIILGSESGYKGSYDLSYALAKSSLKLYIKQKKTKENQQLILLSPSTIENFGMTNRRLDQDRLDSYKSQHPMNRFLNPNELSDLIISLLKSTTYLTNTEIEVYGGKFSLMD